MNKEIDFTEVQQICAAHQIDIRDLQAITGSFAKKIFIINHEYLLRVSENAMTQEQEKFRRVAGLNDVPQILHTGALQREHGLLYYTLLTYLPGDDFVNAYPHTTPAQQKQLGADVAGFLGHLQERCGTHYDIGLYVPALPPFSGTWREGHQQYWERLEQASEKITLKPESSEVFAGAFRYLRAVSRVLNYQRGPKLLHNDFHPKNILLSRGKFSGVIDWECSQFGEADFELCHLIHWCLYPPQPGIDFRMFLTGLFEAYPECAQVPDLDQRLTIYQIEHEIQQIIWSSGAAESLRVPRLIRWLDDGVEDLMDEVGA